jgi:hypothetical protein
LYKKEWKNIPEDCNYMKKPLAFLLTLVFVLSLAACGINDGADGKSQEEKESIILDSGSGIVTDPTATDLTPTIDKDAAIRSELIEQYGLPFRLRRTEGMALWEFTLAENTAKREYHHSMEGSFSWESLSWEIVDGELVVIGDWSETFALDLEAGEAISKSDGAVYRIVEEE